MSGCKLSLTGSQLEPTRSHINSVILRLTAYPAKTLVCCSSLQCQEKVEQAEKSSEQMIPWHLVCGRRAVAQTVAQSEDNLTAQVQPEIGC